MTAVSMGVRTIAELSVYVLVTNAGADGVLVLEAAALEAIVLVKLLTTLTLIGTSVVETTVELAGQFFTSAEHDVTVVMSVL